LARELAQVSMSRTGVNLPALLLIDLGLIAGHGAPIGLGTPTRTRFGLGSIRMGILGPLTAHEVRSWVGCICSLRCTRRLYLCASEQR
jgi:hypothetical protein